MRRQRWLQEIDGHDFLVVVAPNNRAEAWCEAFNYAGYEELEWCVRKGTWLVGCPPGLAYQAPDFEDVEPPAWA